MHHFGGKIDWFGQNKKSLKESSWFREPKCKLGFKVIHFFVFCSFSLFFFTVVVQILWNWKTCYGLRRLLRAHQLPHFSRVDMVGLVHLHKVVARSAFLVFPSAQNGVEMWSRKWRDEMPIFTSGRGFGFTRKL